MVTIEQPDFSESFKLKSNLPKKGIDLAKLLDLKPIYFASNKALILGKTKDELDKIVTYMKKYPSIRIEIGSHTDSKGSDAYNLNYPVAEQQLPQIILSAKLLTHLE